MRMNINLYRLLMVLCSLITANVQAAATIPPQNNPRAVGYTKPPRPDPSDPNDYFWQVSSVYGPRLSSGSKVHGGIDYNQQAGNGDLGVMLRARSAGNIEEIKRGFLRIKTPATTLSPAYSFDYIHIFDKPSVGNSNTIAAGFSKVELGKIKNNAGTGTCNAIFFYDKQAVLVLVKVLTKPDCSNNVQWNILGLKIKPQVKVAAGEPIAPMGQANVGIGTGSVGNVHFHLQLNGGDDNALTKITHSTHTIKEKDKVTEKPRFEVKLVQDTFTDSVLQAMTNGQGFAIEVTENSLVPVLDGVVVHAFNGVILTDPLIFDFGGRIGMPRENVDECSITHPTPCNINAALDLSKGSSKLMIKPIPTPGSNPPGWSEMGTPRIMTFFIPYNISALENAKVYSATIVINTIDNEHFPYSLAFIKNPRFIKIANNGKELPLNSVLGNKATDWACTKDTKTGLIWEVKTDDGGLRDKDWHYTWYNPQYLPDAYYKDGDYVGGYLDNDNDGHDDDGIYDADGIWAGWKNPEQPPYNFSTNTALCNANPTYCNTNAYTLAVNTKTLCAAADWRLPDINELSSVSSSLNHYHIDSSLSAIGIGEPFPTTVMSYWSSVSGNKNIGGDYAWYVSFDYFSNRGNSSKNSLLGVRLVRKGQ